MIASPFSYLFIFAGPVNIEIQLCKQRSNNIWDPHRLTSYQDNIKWIFENCKMIPDIKTIWTVEENNSIRLTYLHTFRRASETNEFVRSTHHTFLLLTYWMSWHIDLFSFRHMDVLNKTLRYVKVNIHRRI